MNPEAFLRLLAQDLGCLLSTWEVALAEVEEGEQREEGVWHALKLKCRELSTDKTFNC